MRVHDFSNLSVITLCSRSRCGAREAMTVGCKHTKELLSLHNSVARNAAPRACQTLPGLPRARAARPSGRFAEDKTPHNIFHNIFHNIIIYETHFGRNVRLNARALAGRALHCASRARCKVKNLPKPVYLCARGSKIGLSPRSHMTHLQVSGLTTNMNRGRASPVCNSENVRINYIKGHPHKLKERPHPRGEGRGLIESRHMQTQGEGCTPRAPSHDFKSNAEGLATSDKGRGSVAKSGRPQIQIFAKIFEVLIV